MLVYRIWDKVKVIDKDGKDDLDLSVPFSSMRFGCFNCDWEGDYGQLKREGDRDRIYSCPGCNEGLAIAEKVKKSDIVSWYGSS